MSGRRRARDLQGIHSLDNLVSPYQERLWDCQAKGLILRQIASDPGDEREEDEEKRKPPVVVRSLLTRGPPSAEPPEAHAKSVPVGKRTALEVQEKVAPARAGIRRTSRSRSSTAR